MKNFSALEYSVFQNCKILLDTQSQLYLAPITVNIILWGCDLSHHQFELTSSFQKCLRQLCGYTYNVKKHQNRNRACMEKQNFNQ